MTTAGYVLNVDDDGDIRESLAYVLTDGGYSVKVACDGHEALEILRASGRPCLILLDIMMPVMDGQQFLHEKDRDAKLAGIPVCVVTAGAPVAATSSVVSIVRKPIDLPKLLDVVEQHC